MGENVEFWNELRNTVMLRGDSWRAVVDSLPERLSATEARKLLQSPSQLANCNMQGVAFLEGKPVYATPNSEVISKHLSAENLTTESLVLQWLYQFVILEGIARGADQLNPDAPMADWPPMLLDIYVQGLHFMVYVAALLCLLEEDKGITCGRAIFMGHLPVASFEKSEPEVRRRVKQTTENLYRKAQDYGESFRRHGVLGLLPRLWDKIARYAQLRSEAHRTPNFESLQDSARDLLGYSVIAWSLVLEIPAVNAINKVEVER